MESKISEANSQVFIFGWHENLLMATSAVNNLFFNGQMVSQTGEANTRKIILAGVNLTNMFTGFTVEMKKWRKQD